MRRRKRIDNPIDKLLVNLSRAALPGRIEGSLVKPRNATKDPTKDLLRTHWNLGLAWWNSDVC